MEGLRVGPGRHALAMTFERSNVIMGDDEDSGHPIGPPR